MSSNTPQLRFAEFSGEWTPSKIGADFRFISTNSLSRDNLNYEEGGVKNIHYGDIHKKFRTLFDVDKEAVPYINSDISLARIGSDNYLQNGDVVFVDASEDYAETGKCIEVKNTANQAIIAGLHTIHARPKYDNTFAVGFFAYLANTRNVRQQIRVISQGTKVLSISPTTLAGVSTFYPKDTAEQQKIGSFLSAVDSKIEGLEQELGLLKRYKQGIMQRLFNQTLRFKDNHGNPFPAWQETTLGAKLEIQIGGSPRPINNFITTDKNGLNWIKIGDVSKDNNIIKETKEKIKPEGLNATREVFVGDLILSNSMSFGRPYILEINGCIHDGWLLIRDAKLNFDKKFLCYLLSSNAVLSQYKALAAGGVVNNLNKELVQGVIVDIPHMDEQKKIADFLSAIDEKIEAKQNQITTARNYKKSLLQKLFV